MSAKDFAELSRALVDVARSLIEKQGGFSPFAMTMDEGGGVAMFLADTGVGMPKASDLLVFLSAALRAMATGGKIRAWGICSNVSARLTGYAGRVDAICCQLEHSGDQSVQIFVPFRKTQSDLWEYDRPVALRG